MYLIFKCYCLKSVATYVFVCACVPVYAYMCASTPRLLLTSNVMWHYMDPICFVKQAPKLCTAVIVVLLVGVALELKQVIETNLIREN